MNRTATFLPKTEPEEVPCIKIGGVIVLAYLDDLTGSLLISIDLETADNQLVRPDDTVPLRIEVQGDAVLDDSMEVGPRGTVSELLD